MVALKEDIKRTSKKLKLWERELEDRKTKLAEQHSKVAKLEEDLKQVTAGESQPTCTICVMLFIYTALYTALSQQGVPILTCA